ncbi:MAG: YgbB family, partial [Acidimicrobiaceae bacterium]|nr:YgbB family [Acidimicrobiaceae bacterium]
SVKAKRAEGLGALGRREGIACYAVALLESS